MKKINENTKVTLTLKQLKKLVKEAKSRWVSDFRINNGELDNYRGEGGDVIIPDGVTSIGYGAFEGCKSLTSVTIPSSVKEINTFAFNYCHNLTSFIVDENNPSYSSVNGLLLSKDGKTLVLAPSGNVKIPDSVTSIGMYAFYGSRLTSITIPDNVTSIEENAFADTNLTSVIIPNSVKRIGKCVFVYCNKLTSVTIGDSVTNIGWHAFAQCDKLSDVKILNPELFAEVIKDPKKYFEGTPWGDNVKGCEVEDGKLTKVVFPMPELVIPKEVEVISSDAFTSVKGLDVIILNDNIKEIEPGAFKSLPPSITIVVPAFSYCDLLIDSGLPDDATIVVKKSGKKYSTKFFGTDD